MKLVLKPFIHLPLKPILYSLLGHLVIGLFLVVGPKQSLEPHPFSAKMKAVITPIVIADNKPSTNQASSIKKIESQKSKSSAGPSVRPPRTPPMQGHYPDNPDQALFTDYAEQIKSIIYDRLEYPRSLQRQGIQGRVLIRLTLLRDGKLSDLSISQSSGNSELDRLAVSAVREADPFPNPPVSQGARQLKIQLPIEFLIVP